MKLLMQQRLVPQLHAGRKELSAERQEAGWVQVLERIADHPISRIADLLPWNLAVAKP
jgi:hypothetical protein